MVLIQGMKIDVGDYLQYLVIFANRCRYVREQDFGIFF
jgi:hypothetical protein